MTWHFVTYPAAQLPSRLPDFFHASHEFFPESKVLIETSRSAIVGEDAEFHPVTAPLARPCLHSCHQLPGNTPARCSFSDSEHFDIRREGTSEIVGACVGEERADDAVPLILRDQEEHAIIGLRKLRIEQVMIGHRDFVCGAAWRQLEVGQPLTECDNGRPVGGSRVSEMNGHGGM